MKKYLALTALLCGTTFASMAEKSPVMKTVDAKELTSQKEIQKDYKNTSVAFFEYQCITINFSCGESGYACGSSVAQISAAAIAFEQIVCG